MHWFRWVIIVPLLRGSLLDNSLWFEHCPPAAATAPGKTIEDIEKEPQEQDWKQLCDSKAAATGSWVKIDVIASGQELSIITRPQGQGIDGLLAG